MTSWTSNRPDTTYKAETAAETEVCRLAKVDALTNHVLRFVGAIRGLVAQALSRNRKPILHSFDGVRFAQELESVRPILNGFYAGEIPLNKAESVLRPFVSESLRGLELPNTFSFTRDALRSIDRIRI